MFFYLFLLFTLIPAIEIYLLIAVGSHLGALNTVGIIVFTGILGAHFAKSQGLSVIHNIQSKSTRGEIPTTELIDGLLILIGGILLITPGFLTDLTGILLVNPITRPLLRSFCFALVKKGALGNVNFYYNNSSYTSHNQDFDHASNDEIKKVDENTFEADFKKK